MAWGNHLARSVHSLSRHAGHAAMTTAHHLDRGLSTVRPIYEASRPALRHLGVDTQLVDRGLTTYDSIRRGLGK